MSAIARTMRESFVPLLAILLGLIGLTAWLDGKAADLAKRETVIRIEAGRSRWDSSNLSEAGLVESMASADLESTSRPEVLSARERARAGDYDKAQELLNAALTATPDDPLVLGELGVIALKRGKLDEAVGHLEAALGRAPNSVALHFNRALVAGRMQAFEVARAHYGKVLELKPNDFEARFNLGLLELTAERPNDAISHFEKAARLGSNVDKARALFSLGVSQARAGKPEDALSSYERAIEFDPGYLLPRYNQAVIFAGRDGEDDKKRAKTLLDQLLALSPDFAPAWFLRGRMASEANDPESALAAYEKAASYDPTFFKARYNAALVALDMGRMDKAKERFERLASDFPERAEPLFNLGRILHKQEDYAGAIAQYEKALALKKDYREAALNLAGSLRAAGRLDDGLRILDELVQAEPKMHAAWLNRGLVFVKLEKPEDARKSLEQAIALKPDYAAAWYNLGKLESGLKRHEQASAAYRKALEADPKNLKAALNLGVELADLEKNDEAIEAYRKALALSPDYAPAHFNLGLALRAVGKLDEAAAAYERVIELDEGHVAARQNLGVVRAKQGRHDDAVAIYRAALDVEPGKVSLRMNLARELRRLGRPEDARVELERVLSLESKHKGATAAMAAIEVESGKPDAALERLAPFVKKGKPTSDMRCVLARAYLDKGDLANARTEIDGSLKTDPDDATALATSARIAWREGRKPEARALYEKARAADNEDPEVARAAQDLAIQE